MTALRNETLKGLAGTAGEMTSRYHGPLTPGAVNVISTLFQTFDHSDGGQCGGC